MIRVILSLIFPTVVHSCLVVRTTKCECDSMALDISNIQSIIGDREFYRLNISQNSISAPIISIDDCHTSIRCEGDSSLVVFDGTEKYHMFGAYSADGLCDAYTQKWLVDDLSVELTTYGKMQAVCVDYASCCSNPFTSPISDLCSKTTLICTVPDTLATMTLEVSILGNTSSTTDPSEYLSHTVASVLTTESLNVTVTVECDRNEKLWTFHEMHYSKFNCLYKLKSGDYFPHF